MNVLDLFSGIGGFSLGLRRAGFNTVAFCEIDPWCRRLLAKHWPEVPAYEDVRELTSARLRADGIPRIDVICGGFPCQDISTAGAGAGLAGERSGLWREFARLIGELRPRYAIVENVGALRGRGLAAVLGDLAAIGYGAEWHAIPAAAVGAPHLRDRVWIIARPAADADRIKLRQHEQREATGRYDLSDGRQAVAGDDGAAWPVDEWAESECRGRAMRHSVDPDSAVQRLRASGRDQSILERSARPEPDDMGADRRRAPAATDPSIGGPPQRGRLFGRLARALAAASAPWERTAEPPFRGVDDGLPAGLDGPGRTRHARVIRTQDRERTKSLGNAVVPMIPELIGRALLGDDSCQG